MKTHSSYIIGLFLVLTGVLLSPVLLKAQDIYVYEYGKNQDRHIVEISNDQIVRRQVGNFIDWYLDKNGGVIGGNSSLVLRQSEKELDTLLNAQRTEGISEILNIASNGERVIFTTYEDFNEYEQSYKSMKLYSLNIKCQTLSTIELSDSLNFFYIGLSPDGKKILFTHISHYDISNRFNTKEKSYLLIYDMDTDNLVTVDSAKYTEGEWFKTTPVWIDNDSFFYYKKSANKEKGQIFKCNFNNNKTSAFFEIPFKNTECFSYWDNLFFFIENNQVVSVDMQGNKKIWYQSDKGSFLQQKILVQ